MKEGHARAGGGLPVHLGIADEQRLVGADPVVGHRLEQQTRRGLPARAARVHRMRVLALLLA